MSTWSIVLSPLIGSIVALVIILINNKYHSTKNNVLLNKIGKLITTSVVALSDKKLTEDEVKEIVRQLTEIIDLIRENVGKKADDM